MDGSLLLDHVEESLTAFLLRMNESMNERVNYFAF